MVKEVHAISRKNKTAFLNVTHSTTGRRWLAQSFDDRNALALTQKLGVPEIIGRILAARGVNSSSAEGYLSPKIRDVIPDPSILRDMDSAADRLAAAIINGEKIAIFGDYDVDGGTSTALLVRFLRSVNVQPEIYIPDRLSEGYGPNSKAMLGLASRGAKVIVTVDCGINSFDSISCVSDKGVDVIVVDHHISGPSLPPAYAVVNPNRIDENSSLGNLAAVGVTLLLVVATNRTLRNCGWYVEFENEPNIMEWLDLVALGTVCDVVPLTGLNRAFVFQGLKVMGKRKNRGLAALSDVARLDGAPNTYHIGFILGPRVNAGGRVGRSNLGASLLCSDDPAAAKIMAIELDDYNSERQEIESKVLFQAREQISMSDDSESLIFVSGENWHPGVIGIVASRLTNLFRRPSIVISINGSQSKGSGRSIRGIDLGSLVLAARQEGLLDNGGGHPMAAGFSLKTSKIEGFCNFLDLKIRSKKILSHKENDLFFDGTVTIKAADMSLISHLESAGPYGSGNPEPRLAIPSVRVVKADIVGNGHVRAILTDDGNGGTLRGIAFNAADEPHGHALLSAKRSPLHIAGYLRADTWKSNNRPQLFIEDVGLA